MNNETMRKTLKSLRKKNVVCHALFQGKILYFAHLLGVKNLYILIESVWVAGQR